MRMRILVFIAALACSASAFAQSREFKLVVHPSNAITKVSKMEAANIFLKKQSRWSNGQPIVVVDHHPDSTARQSFSMYVLNKSVQSVKIYWQQQVFSGRDVPPIEKATDDEVIAFVNANPNAIGYIHAGGKTGGLKTIEIGD